MCTNHIEKSATAVDFFYTHGPYLIHIRTIAQHSPIKHVLTIGGRESTLQLTILEPHNQDSYRETTNYRRPLKDITINV